VLGRVLISSGLWLSALVFFALFGSAFGVAAVLLGPHRVHRFARFACRCLLFFGGQRVVLHDAFPDRSAGPYIYMFNHVSLLDTFVVIATVPEFTAAIGKAEQFKVPLWGWILKRWGAVPIERDNLGKAIEKLSQVESVVKNGQSLVIAPEGTRSPDGSLQAFKKGPFHIALNAKVSIVPIAISGSFRSKRKGSWHLRPGTIDVRVAETVVVSQMDEPSVESIRDETRARIGALLAAETL